MVVRFSPWRLNWPDYVFKSDYRLRPLSEIERHITERGHLPNLPSAEDIAKHGVNVGEMDAKLVEKIEELTLYTIQQDKQIKAQNVKVEKLEKLVQQLLSTQKP